MKTCFYKEKLIKQFATPPPFSREPPPPPLQLTPLILSNFFMTPFFFQILKIRTPSHSPKKILGGKTMKYYENDWRISFPEI